MLSNAEKELFKKKIKELLKKESLDMDSMSNKSIRERNIAILSEIMKEIQMEPTLFIQELQGNESFQTTEQQQQHSPPKRQNRFETTAQTSCDNNVDNKLEEMSHKILFEHEQQYWMMNTSYNNNNNNNNNSHIKHKSNSDTICSNKENNRGEKCKKLMHEYELAAKICENCNAALDTEWQNFERIKNEMDTLLKQYICLQF